MKIEQIYTGCLAQGAYYIESEGEVAIIDPLREVQQYIDITNSNNAKIKYILETHFHADFVSGHLTLSQQTGAKIIYGPTAKTDFNSHIAKDGEVFKLGNLTITVLHTPGHTMESTTYLLKDKNGKDHAIFSGDTLFLGDVGRPDLAQKGANMTQEELAATLYKSLRTKIMTLADDVIVYPGHGAGSACGKNLSKETVGTIGDQKKTNYALRSDMTEEEFIKEVTCSLAPPPKYFPENVKLNKQGYEAVDKIIENNKALSAQEFKEKSKDALILDVRSADDFAKEHIPNSIFIGIDGGFAPWVGALLTSTKQPIILVTPEGRAKETIIRLSRVGFDHTLGFIKGGVQTWVEAGFETTNIKRITADELEEVAKINAPIIDVRKQGEYNNAHLIDVPNIPLDVIEQHIDDFPKNETTYIHCAGGYRSMIAASILKKHGYHNIIDVIGGFGKIKNTNLPIKTGTCPNAKK